MHVSFTLHPIGNVYKFHLLWPKWSCELISSRCVCYCPFVRSVKGTQLRVLNRFQTNPYRYIKSINMNIAIPEIIKVSSTFNL